MRIASLILGLLSVNLLLTQPSLAKKTPRNEDIENANKAAAAGNWELTSFYASTAVEKEPENDVAWSLLGQAQMALGDTAASVASYQTALSHKPTQPDAVLTLVYHFIQTNKLPEAERIVVQAEKSDPKGKIDEIKVARGLIYSKQGNFQEATRLLVSATEKNKSNPLYPQFLARLYNDAGIKEQAAIYYEQAWKLNPKNLDMAYEYALVLQDLTRYAEALDLFRTVQANAPENKAVDYMIGRLYYAARKWNEASQSFRMATEKRPNHFLSHFLLGKSLLELSKAERKNFYPQAEASLRRARELTTNTHNVDVVLAEVLFIQAKLFYQIAMTDSTVDSKALSDSALMYNREVLTLDSSVTGVYSQMARAWAKLGNLDSTIFYTKLQIAQTPDDATEFARLVSTLQRKKDFAGLVDALTPVFEALDWSQPKAAGDTLISPQDTFISKYGGVFLLALFETKQDQLARSQLARIHTYKPDWADGYSLSAYIELKKQNWAGAIPILQAGVKNCPDNGDLWLSLGDSYYFANPNSKEQLKKAKECYLKSKQLGNKDGAEKYDLLNK